VEGELVDDFASIHAFIDKMDSDAEHFHAVVLGVGDTVCARERGQEGRMQVDDAHGESF
jgi:hypothetical protein